MEASLDWMGTAVVDNCCCTNMLNTNMLYKYDVYLFRLVFHKLSTFSGRVAPAAGGYDELVQLRAPLPKAHRLRAPLLLLHLTPVLRLVLLGGDVEQPRRSFQRNAGAGLSGISVVGNIVLPPRLSSKEGIVFQRREPLLSPLCRSDEGGVVLRYFVHAVEHHLTTFTVQSRDGMLPPLCRQ